MMEEEEPERRVEAISPVADEKTPDDEAVDVDVLPDRDTTPVNNGTIRTLDGELVGDELEGDAINYQILLGKIDGLLDRLKLDA